MARVKVEVDAWKFHGTLEGAPAWVRGAKTYVGSNGRLFVGGTGYGEAIVDAGDWLVAIGSRSFAAVSDADFTAAGAPRS